MKEVSELKDYIRKNTRDFVQFQTVLTSIKALAPENGGDGELKKCEAIENYLKAHGITKLERFDAPDSRVSCGFRPNLVATIDGDSDEKTLWFIAHTDVVPSGDLSLWETDPWTVVEKDGKLFGRGVEDDQQGLVSAVAAACAFVALKVKPTNTVKILFAADEEVGSTYGVQYLLKNHNLFRKQDLIVIPDGGDAKGETIEVAEKNILWMELKVTGKQCHGSRPMDGNNACLAAADLTMRLNNFEKVFNQTDDLFDPPYSTFQPTMRKANVEGVNIIPGSDIFYMDCRVLPSYKNEDITNAVYKECSEIEKKYGVKVDVAFPQKAESKATDKNALVVQKLSEALSIAHGIKAYTIGIGGGTVGAELRNLGYECAVWSTLDEKCHTPNEYCVIENMIKDAETMATLMLL